VAEPAGKPARTIRLTHAPGPDGIGAFSITANGRTCHYTFREMRCDIGGRGFAIHRLGLGTLYHTRAGRPSDWSCECKGFLFRGYCRHVLGLAALIRERKV
jgi:SWIM zinc finger